MEGKKEDRRIRKRKKAVHDAFFSLLEEKNISEISIVELTELADMNRKTFYNHYTDINALIDEIEDDWIDENVRILKEKLQENGLSRTNGIREFSLKAEAVASPYFETLITILEENQIFLQRLLKCGGYSNLLKKIVKKNKEILYEFFGEQKDSVWVEFFLTFMVNGTISVVNLWNEERTTVSRSELVEFFRMIFTAEHIYQFLEQMSKKEV